MKVIVKSHTVVNEEVMFVSGHIGRKEKTFNDVQINTERLIEFIRAEVPSYILRFSSLEVGENHFGMDFDQERLLEEIDYSILAEYITEANLLNT